MRYLIAIFVGVSWSFADKLMSQTVPKEITVSMQDANWDCSHTADVATQKPCKFHNVTLIFNDDHTVSWR